jgi:hypothetical protein
MAVGNSGFANLVTSKLHTPIFSHIFPDKSVQNTGLFITPWQSVHLNDKKDFQRATRT